MLDNFLTVRYSDDMTTYRKAHPPIYYTIRGLVRWTFWTGLTVSLFATVGWATAALGGEVRECPVSLRSDFTYVQVEPFDVGDCEPPPYVVLYDEETWGWGD